LGLRSANWIADGVDLLTHNALLFFMITAFLWNNIIWIAWIYAIIEHWGQPHGF